ncbi:HDOD domain-containing protein [Sulfurimonas autotrophica]|uniref:Putative signal transduction protein n=1 Tax=Sulfurimonas autotrophica (strain ATCC BAA-671 / DSM 16294 / JCM 11897 / OK10) TaxID=563040 RepID=E0USC9_SULAO|nr:HDOD domain-containing protein [Sulfurimonas autotrophica]ADN09092.1 putative signal transduction protein [Sulfurimonas autotrophica DSM 16294]
MNFEAIVSTIDSLPPLLDTTLIINKLYADGDENIDIRKLIVAIESDSLLSINILKMVNSPLYGLSQQIVSVTQAVTLFGTQKIYGLALAYSINNIVRANIRPYGVTNRVFNDISHLQSRLVSQWFSKIDKKTAKYLSPLALIMESGKLILAKEIVSASQIKEFNLALSMSENIPRYENDIFGTSSYYVGGLLFEHWNLNPRYVDILKSLDFEYESKTKIDVHVDILDIVRTAINIKEILNEKSIAKASEMVEELGFNVDNFIDTAEEIQMAYIGNSR